MHHYSKVPRHLPHPSPYFYRGSKSAIFGLIAQQRSNLSPCGLETEQDISTTIKLRVQGYLAMSPANVVQIGPRVFQITYAKVEAPPKNGRNICR